MELTLAAHAPQLRDLDEFRDWVFITVYGSLVSIHPKFKERLIERLNSHVNSIFLQGHEGTNWYPGASNI